jgi:HAD superfamily phosphatase (TIGR01668 family)
MCESTYSIDYKYLWDKGYRGIIFDIDNTLVEHNEPATEKAVAFFKELRRIGFRSAVVSNNKEPRVRLFAEAAGCEYVYKAGKPKAAGYIKAMEKMGTDRDTTFSVGDQLFTDIWGASNAGIKSIMVKRIASHEEIQIHLKRIPETLITVIYRLLYKKRSEKDLL